jgi:hypothetical protein
MNNNIKLLIRASQYIQTKVLNDLDEKVHKMAEIIIEKPSMQKVIYKLEKPSEELAFAYYILFICSHVYSMRQIKVLNEDEWFNPNFENFINKEVASKLGSK